METVELAEEYSQLLEQSRRKGETGDRPQGAERRQLPRLKVNSTELWIDAVVEFSVIDMSPSGVALICNFPVMPGEMLKFSLGPVSMAEAEIIDCTIVESATDHLDGMFHVRCKFTSKIDGTRLLVKTKQLEREAPR